MGNDIETARWEQVMWICPRCIKDYDADDADVSPPMVGPVGDVDHSVDSRAIWGAGDEYDYDFDFDLWKRRNVTEPVVYCRSCDTVFDVTFEAREGQDE